MFDQAPGAAMAIRPAAPLERGCSLRRVAAVCRWFDTKEGTDAGAEVAGNEIDWIRATPFIAMHLACLAVLWVGVSWIAVALAGALYVIRMFALTAFYHRYFSHRTFRTSRAMQFVFALFGATCVQRGPLWWAAHHRNHHLHADTASDPHSPRVYGFLRSHVGWFLTSSGFRTDWKRIPDLARYPELRWVDRYDVLIPVLLAVLMYSLGALLNKLEPELRTSGGQLLTWGFFISTVALFHASVTINSLAHRFGSRRFHTRDDSRNNPWLALITLGEGWHNNHHFFPGSARQGFRWYELDVTYYGLKFLAAVRLIHDLRPVPARIHARSRN